MASTGISLRDSRRSLTVGGGLVARRFILHGSLTTTPGANSCARSPPIHREVGIVDTMHLRASIFVVLASVAAGCGTAGTLPDGAGSAAGRAGAGGRVGANAQAGAGSGANAGAAGSATSAGSTGAAAGSAGAAGKAPAAGGSGGGGLAGNAQGGETAQAGSDNGGGAAGDGGGEPSGAGGGDGSAGAGGEPPTDPCPDESKLVYVLTDDRQLYRFDPPVLTFTKVGKLDCKNSSSAYSMAVSRSGIAYAVLDDGSLQSIDVKTAKCTATTFKPNQQGFSMFGMGFTSKDAADETLYVSDEAGKNLGKIDTTTFVLTKVGTFDKLGSARSELTGNSAGELFGAFEGSPYNVAQIDPATAKILSTVPQKPVTKSSGGSNFAFASWGGKFFLFVGPGSSTDVFVYDPIAKTTVKKKSVSQVIVGAGVSTCAPRTSEQ